MTIHPISFGAEFKTREVANIVAGKDFPSPEFISKISDVPIDSLTTKNNSDMFAASASYCSKQIPKINPQFNLLRELATAIREEFLKVSHQEKRDLTRLSKLFDRRDEQINSVCERLGDTIDIEPFHVPFLKK